MLSHPSDSASRRPVRRALSAIAAQTRQSVPISGILALAVSIALAKALSPASAWLLGRAVESMRPNGATLWGLAATGIAVAYLATKMADTAMQWIRAGLGTRAMSKIHQAMASKAYRGLAFGPASLLREPAGALSSKAESASQSRSVFSFTTYTIIPAFLELAFSCVGIAASGLPQAAAGVGAAAGLILLMSLWLGPKLSRAADLDARAEAASRAASFDILPAFIEAKSFGRELEAAQTFERSLSFEIQQQIQSKTLDQTIDASYMASAGIGASITFLLGARAVADGSIDSGNFVAAMAMAAVALTPVSQLGWAFRELLNSCSKLGNALDLIETPAESQTGADPAAQAARLSPSEPLLSVRSLRYASGPKTLLDIDRLDIFSGQKIALVGESGSGKSTLCLALSMLAPFDEGTMSLAGVDSRQANPSCWRRLASWAPQAPTPRMCDALEFLRWSDPELDAPGARSLLARLGLDLDPLQKIGPGGRPLSGGEWQRLSLARALASKTSKLLLLDEPSSALDAASEALAMKAILSDSRAVLAITHRLGHARAFDKIALMKQGRILEFGSHEELIALGGAYAELWRSASEGFL